MKATALILFLLAGSVSAQPVTFNSQTIDASSAGDDKALADILGDGKMDPILGGPYLYWYEVGAGYARRTIRSNPNPDEFTTDMQVGDIDNDGNVDLIIADSGPNNVGTIFWVKNPRPADPRVGSNWVFRTVGTQGAVVHDIEVADLDNDGKMDIITSGHGVTKLWKQNTPTSWTSRTITSFALGGGVFIGDVDGDGLKDIATPYGWNKNPGNIISGTWINYPINGANSEECALADLNGDGKLDLIVCPAHDRGEFAWFQQPANPTSSAWTKRVIDSGMGAHKIEITDFNQDGRKDIMMGLELQDISVYINQGGAPPSFTKVQLDTSCGHNARAGDINGDGKVDVFGCDYIGNPPARVYLNQTVIQPCYANCDGSTVQPILNGNDFQCFLNTFASGCP
jgi:hypothetical protein